MKRSYRVLSGILLALLLGWLLFIFPVTINKEIVLPFSIYRCGEQLNKATVLAKWLAPFSGETGTLVTDSGKLQKLVLNNQSAQVEDPSPFGSLIQIQKGHSHEVFSYTVSADSGKVQSSVVSLRYKSNLFRKWFGKNQFEQEAEQSLENLRAYMTDTKRFYGYEIQYVKVEDTAFLFARSAVPLAEKRKGIVQLFDKLIGYAEKHQSGYNGNRIFYSMESGQEIILFAGIGVTVMTDTRDAAGIEYKRMPYGKNLLVTNYQGPFGQSGKAFEALEKFKADQQLSSMAIPYQKFMSDGYDFADDQMVQLKIYYPIF